MNMFQLFMVMAEMEHRSALFIIIIIISIFTPLQRLWTVLSMRAFWLCVRPFLRLLWNVRVCTANKRLDLQAPIFCTYACWQGTFASNFPSKSYTSLAYIFKVRYKASKMESSYVIISQTVTDRTNIASANTYKVTCDLSIGIFTFDLAHSKGQG